LPWRNAELLAEHDQGYEWYHKPSDNVMYPEPNWLRGKILQIEATQAAPKQHRENNEEGSIFLQAHVKLVALVTN
jgi:hypothetical protein